MTNGIESVPLFWPVRRWLEIALWGLGIASIGSAAYQWWQGAYAQARGSEELAELSTTVPKQATFSEGATLGRLEINRLALSAVIFEGTSSATLVKGVGHLQGTAQLGESSNIVLAAHRDTFFRPLKNIRSGDVIQLSSPSGANRYQVRSTEIVNPSQVEVVQPTDDNELTLITCYPFSYWGAAPQRFIVHAVQVWK